MCNLYVTEHGGVIGCEQNRFELRHQDKKTTSIPVEILDSIEIHGKSHMTAHAIEECLRRNIPVSFHSGDGRYIGMLSPTGKTNVYRQKLQVKKSEDVKFSVSFAKNIIDAKIHNQIVILRRYERYKTEKVSEKIREMKCAKKNLVFCNNIEEIMGYEGYAAKGYFSALGKLVDENFSFDGRSRRPPKDEFNALLSMGYSILFHEIYTKVEKKGLNSYFGIMHSDKQGHPSLVSDLMEEWRPVIVDSLVMGLVNGHEIKKEHFIKAEEKETYYLTREGKCIFLEKMEKCLQREINYLDYISYPVNFRQALELQVNQFCRCLESGNVNDYQPIKIR